MKNPRILIIDDDPNVLSVVGGGLRLRGCEVKDCDNGPQGLTAADDGETDLIILDINLPGLDGYEICQKLKADEKTSSIPVIFLSANESPEERVKGLRMGAVDYVVKPYDLDELLARIDIALRIKAAVPDEPVLEKLQPEKKKDAKVKVCAEEKRAIPREEFLQQLHRRFDRLDKETGLLTLIFLRLEPEKLLRKKEKEEFRQSVVSGAVEILDSLIPDNSLIGEMDPIQLGVLIPRKNKYGAELILNDFQNELGLRDFEDQGEPIPITACCGVAEYPHARIETGEDFEKTAEFALRRAAKGGQDRIVLL